MTDNLIYIIYPTNKLEEIDFSQVVENNSNTLRTSVDGTKTILKFTGETPSFLNGFNKYNQEQILKEINNLDNGWIDNNLINI